MVCGWCQKPGHTIAKCSEEGAREERERRRSDPKEVAKREKVAKKKEEENQEVRRRLGVTEVEKPLRKVNIEPGRLKKEYEAACETVEGAIDTVLTSEYLNNILQIVNENRYATKNFKANLISIQGEESNRCFGETSTKT